MEDKKIIDLYFDRNELAIQETSNKYGHYCFSVAYNILFNREDSEECVSDTWRTTWNLIPPNRPNKFKFYLAKITRGIALNMFRKITAEKRGGLETDVVFEELENTLASSADPQQDFRQKELSEFLNRFLNRQSQRERNLFIRRYFYMESVKKIAKQFNLTESNVSVILNRVRNSLKEELREEGYL